MCQHTTDDIVGGGRCKEEAAVHNDRGWRDIPVSNN